MDILLLLLFAVSIYGVKFTKVNDGSYLAPERTNCINGIFVMLVFFTHFKTYAEPGQLDKIYYFVNGKMGQLVVVSFLFFSGYGIMYSIFNKSKYIDRFPIRFLKVLLEFDIAVLLFLAVNLLLGNEHSLSEILLSFIAWESIGNSNWYVFAILALYIITFISFKIPSVSYSISVIIVFILTAAYIAAMTIAGKESWWYDTVMAYPAGMMFCLYKDRFDKFISGKKYSYYLTLAGLLGVFAVTYKFKNFITLSSVMAVCFILVIMMLSMKIKIGNKALGFLGKYTFEIYILQRISFMICKRYISNIYIMFIISIISTLILSIALKKLFSMIFSPIEKSFFHHK